MNRDPAFDRGVIDAIPILRRQAISLCRDLNAAEDMVSSAVLRAFDKHELFRPGSNLIAWLLMIMRNEHYSAWRRQKREVEDVDGLIAASVPVGEGQSAAADLKVIRKRMRFLNPLQRRCVEKVAILGYAMEDVAQEEGVPVGTIKSSLHRARTFLETGKECEEEPEVPEEQEISSASRIATLYMQGKSLTEIVSEIGGIRRSDVMRVVVERNLPARAA